MTSKTKTNHELHACIFFALGAGCMLLLQILIGSRSCLLVIVQSKCFRWFWFYDTQLKTTQLHSTLINYIYMELRFPLYELLLIYILPKSVHRVNVLVITKILTRQASTLTCYRLLNLSQVYLVRLSLLISPTLLIEQYEESWLLPCIESNFACHNSIGEARLSGWVQRDTELSLWLHWMSKQTPFSRLYSQSGRSTCRLHHVSYRLNVGSELFTIFTYAYMFCKINISIL